MTDRESTTGPTAETRTKRNHRRLRRVGVVVGCLLAGAIINVLVAWGLTFWQTPNISSLIDDRVTLECRELYQRFVPGWQGELRTGGTQGIFKRLEWVSPDGNRFDTSPFRTVVRLQSGFPLHSLYFVEVAEWPTTPGVPAIRQDSSIGMFDTARGVLPTRPRWLGFFFNSLFFGAIAWLFFAAPLAVRRQRRAKRNRCPDCGYDLRGADHVKCPECGEAIKVTAVP